MTRHAARGFTLLELLVVMTIVSLGTLLSVAWLGGDGQQRLDAAAERLYSDLTLARDLAVGQQAVIGWQLTDQGYRFVTWRFDQETHTWQWTLLASEQLTPQTWPAALTLDTLPMHEAYADADMPRLIWWPNGEVLGGRLTLHHAGARRAIEVDALGVYRVQAAGRS